MEVWELFVHDVRTVPSGTSGVSRGNMSRLSMFTVKPLPTWNLTFKVAFTTTRRVIIFLALVENVIWSILVGVASVCYRMSGRLPRSLL